MEIIEIENIEFTNYETKMVDLKVEDNHNFILANGILTHNCGKDLIRFKPGLEKSREQPPESTRYKTGDYDQGEKYWCRQSL